MMKKLPLMFVIGMTSVSLQSGVAETLLAPGATLQKLADGFRFTEGPAADAEGNVYFSDIPNRRIHIWTTDGRLETFMENSGGANGLFFDRSGNLIACQGADRQLVSIDSGKRITVLADSYAADRKLNSPNDLWIDPKGGIYFSDPRYGNRSGIEQDGEHVYYLSPDREKLIRVIDNMVRPNGLIGTPDGRVLYVTDHGGGATYRYRINSDGTLFARRLFASVGADGMTMDETGNVYLAADAVRIFSPDGRFLEKIDVPERPSNVCFGGRNGRTLFITARTSLYAVEMAVRGAQ